MIQIPQELVSLVSERRLIPFIGAGFSSALGLPDWASTLRNLCADLEDDMSFEDLSDATGGDYLQIAEYLFLKNDRQIGPIRRQLERSLSSHEDPLSSGPHIELANLGAPQIYTTNYDDLIEQTYKNLGLPASTVVLPKDVALAHTDRTQIVKYHGDLAHEKTLVLTESAYYKRLDFESPMDLKFRSDLLGKSVLFMGYSFRDVNIRIIWFKLMEMMRDIPAADRRPSYIVRLDPNPAVDALNAAVGLQTIVLNPDGDVTDPTERTKLLGEFLLKLSLASSEDGVIPGSMTKRNFVSSSLISSMMERHEKFADRFTARSLRLFGAPFGVQSDASERLMHGTVPEPIQAKWGEAVLKLAPILAMEHGEALTESLGRMPSSRQLTSTVVYLLTRNGNSDVRKIKPDLISNSEIWPRVWENALSEQVIEQILDGATDEINYQVRSEPDEDIAYFAEILVRIVKTNLGAEANEEQMVKANEILERCIDAYPTIADLSPALDAAPDLVNVLDEVKEKARKRMTSVNKGRVPRSLAVRPSVDPRD